MSDDYQYENPQQAQEIENDNIDSNYQTNEGGGLKKKNRTLQYYKFLFYSMKTELKLHDFIKLIRVSNYGEISIWVISLILYANTPKDFPKLSDGEKSTSYKNVFIWFHFIHIIRAALGIFLMHTFPKSFEIINKIESYSDSKLEKTLFNDLIRETIFFNVTEKIKPRKIPIIIYLILTLVNFIFDLIDFLVILSALSGAKPEAKVVLLTYLIIAVLYMAIDCSYIFWTGQLKYVFPKEYLKPIDAIFNGLVDKAMTTFKLKKPKTDIVAEAKAQQSGQRYVKSSNEMNNGGVNILENIFSDSFGIYKMPNYPQHGNQEKEDNRQRFPNNNNYAPGSEEQMNENRLDE
jgi:hypothetical protein